jgi:hypothetical protein
MGYEGLVGQKVFIQEYMASSGWGGMLRRLGMSVVDDDRELRFSTVKRFLISRARLGLVAANSQTILNDTLQVSEARNGLVMAKNRSVIYSQLNSDIESAGLVSVWARGIDHEILGQAFLDLLARQAALG